jgi:hypothetical protein
MHRLVIKPFSVKSYQIDVPAESYYPSKSYDLQRSYDLGVTVIWFAVSLKRLSLGEPFQSHHRSISELATLLSFFVWEFLAL